MNYSQLLWDCWAYGASYLPLCGLPNWAAAFLPQLGSGEIIPLGSRRFRVLQKLGEGGYAVVYLVSEMATADHPHPDPELRALKKVLVQSSEHFDAVQQEMLVHSAVQHHPNILPLLDYCCAEGTNGGAAAAAVAVPALTPPAPQLPPPPHAAGGNGSISSGGGGGGSLAVPVSVSASFPAGGVGRGGGDLPTARSGPSGGSYQIHNQIQIQNQDRMACFLFPAFRAGTLASELERLVAGSQMLSTSDVLAVFTQIAKATAHVHAHGYAHRDIKPLNVLVAVNPDHPASGRQQQQQPGRQGAPAGGWRPAGRLGERGRVDGADVEAGLALTAETSTSTSIGRDVGPRYRCVLMDFGSARPRTVRITSRSQALQLQEDAEAHCSAPYRAPELFDVPSGSGSAPLDLDLAAADVWALGASLFHIMYGEPPFQRAMNASGGSLALAVLNCAIGWPRPPSPAYPPELHQLVTAALVSEPAARPSAAQLAQMAEALTQRGLPDPDPQPYTGVGGAAPKR
ncbi:hypothetical protein PLESTM_000286100 [Pleodorina starrii]|nr:hypothetical protein PLESTM_000286100 [Pleodorina starrii]